jgi:hypothetical protein
LVFWSCCIVSGRKPSHSMLGPDKVTDLLHGPDPADGTFKTAHQ